MISPRMILFPLYLLLVNVFLVNATPSDFEPIGNAIDTTPELEAIKWNYYDKARMNWSRECEFVGGNIGRVTTDTIAQCLMSCRGTPRCRRVTWFRVDGSCFLKGNGWSLRDSNKDNFCGYATAAEGEENVNYGN
jgi:hypothetical protein